MQPEDEIKRIQKEYIKLLESRFENLWQKFEHSNLSISDFLSDAVNLPISNLEVMNSGKSWSSLSYHADQLLSEISAFWKKHQDSLQNALKSSSLLITQIGDLNGRSHHYHYYREAILRLGLYFDSICVIDPLALMAQRKDAQYEYFNRRDDDPILIQFLFCFLETHRLKPLILSDTEAPIAIICPPAGIVVNDTVFNQILKSSRSATFTLFAEAFNQQVESLEDLALLADRKTIQDFDKVFQAHSVLGTLFKDIGFNSVTEIVDLARSQFLLPPESSHRVFRLPAKLQWLSFLFGTLHGIIMAQEGAVYSASVLRIDINIPLQLWNFNQFRLQNIEKVIRQNGLRAEIPVQAAIMSKSMDWMAAATIDDLALMRKEGVMEHVRDIYRIKRRELQQASTQNFVSATQAVVDEVTAALQQTMQEIKAIETKSSRDLRKRVTEFLILTGGLGIASTFIPVLGWVGLGVSILYGGASIKDIIENYSAKKEKRQELQSRPITHMLEIWKRQSL